MTTLEESGAATALPLIDILRLRGPAADRAEFLGELRRAAHDAGFFCVDRHNILNELDRDDVLRVFAEFAAEHVRG
ncbi:2-oxoglutarate and iron-dependent oxygenase domain-containing protein [Amycolatopsis sp. WQ 127309]|uniref:2-oxoglutarate and iron-dependent oxygenase domain-containing protein n=1 Tax=Amycolatopsis sp. WQ 127309 TaxID=2932773 RepID=UPI001FF124D7|nr:2-oxoglutarate and iron-dependent oxygenase domain-containing protein [Amycolatopsis sp. WQ 127309]UOZ03321.1 hypothetical protein MUY22_31250 [Amycolatopsis sp. WQ 127309]